MKTKLFLIPLLALLAELPTTTAADETNLVSNPSFESADAGDLLADDWTTQKGIPVERITEGGHAGKAFVRFKDDSATKAQSVAEFRYAPVVSTRLLLGFAPPISVDRACMQISTIGTVIASKSASIALRVQ